MVLSSTLLVETIIELWHGFLLLLLTGLKLKKNLKENLKIIQENKNYSSSSVANYISSLAWYDYDLVAYQKERNVTDLEKTFDERNLHIQEHGGIDLNAVHLKPKEIKPDQPDWQKTVKTKKNQDYYDKLQELENEQLLKEQRTRERNHQYAIPGESVAKSSLARGMASQYESQM